MARTFLIMQRGDDIGRCFYLKHGQITLGRNPDNDVVVNEVAVSRYHAVFKYDAATGEVTVTDLGSTNGVTVNSVDIKTNTPYKLAARDLVFVGRAALSLQIRADSLQPAPVRRELDSRTTQRLYFEPQYQEPTLKM